MFGPRSRVGKEGQSHDADTRTDQELLAPATVTGALALRLSCATGTGPKQKPGNWRFILIHPDWSHLMTRRSWIRNLFAARATRPIRKVPVRGLLRVEVLEAVRMPPISSRSSESNGSASHRLALA
jgi:hypothetical protein